MHLHAIGMCVNALACIACKRMYTHATTFNAHALSFPCGGLGGLEVGRLGVGWGVGVPPKGGAATAFTHIWFSE